MENISEIKEQLLGKIADEMSKQNISQAQIAEQLGITKQAVSKYFSSPKGEGVTIDKLIAVLDVLKIKSKVKFD